MRDVLKEIKTNPVFFVILGLSLIFMGIAVYFIGDFKYYSLFMVLAIIFAFSLCVSSFKNNND